MVDGKVGARSSGGGRKEENHSVIPGPTQKEWGMDCSIARAQGKPLDLDLRALGDHGDRPKALRGTTGHLLGATPLTTSSAKGTEMSLLLPVPVPRVPVCAPSVPSSSNSSLFFSPIASVTPSALDGIHRPISATRF
jgi:hypothetical protein